MRDLGLPCASLSPGDSTKDHSFTFQQLRQRAAEWHQPLWVAAIDFKKAFDIVEHSSVWTALRDQGMEETYIQSRAGSVRHSLCARPLALSMLLSLAHPFQFAWSRKLLFCLFSHVSLNLSTDVISQASVSQKKVWERCRSIQKPTNSGKVSFNITTTPTNTDLLGIDGETIEFEWNIFPEHTTLQILQDVQDKMEACQTSREEFEDRIIFMSVFNDIYWTKKGN